MRADDIIDAAIDGLNAIITHPRIEREIAFFVDVVICVALAIIPSIGIKLTVAYFLIRDIRQFIGFGKKLYGLHIISTETGESVQWRLILVRNLFLLIPGLNIVDIIHFLRTKRRLTDFWLEIDVKSPDSYRQENDTEEEDDFQMPEEEDEEQHNPTPASKDTEEDAEENDEEDAGDEGTEDEDNEKSSPVVEL